MNIGIDIDDTITETSELLMPYVAEYFSIDIDYLKKNNICYNNLPKEYKEKEKEFGKSTFGRVLLDVRLKENAKEIIDKLKEDGHKIVIITARDETIYDAPFEFTKKQLKKLRIEYDKLFCTFDKKQICIDENIDFFIDDSVENLNNVEDTVGQVLLFNSKTNMRENNHFIRVNSWKEIYNYISDYNNTKQHTR